MAHPLRYNYSDMESPQLKVYSASAGSGKTFRLAVEFIKLLLAKPTAYRHVLAVTFTNKATAEMKQRIVEQLYGLSHNLPSSAAYAEKLREETGLPAQALQQRAGLALHTLLHDYSHFRISTIDSFFQTVVRSMARELGLSAQLDLELNTDLACELAVDKMIESLTPQSPERSWMVNYMREKIADGKSWNVSKDLKDFAKKNLFNERYLLLQGARRTASVGVADGVSGHLQTKEIDRFEAALKARMQQVRDTFKQLSDGFDLLLKDVGLTLKDLSGESRCSAALFFNRIKKCQRDDMTPEKVYNDTTRAWLAHSEAWLRKDAEKTKQGQRVLQLVEHDLRPYLLRADEIRQREYPLWLSCEAALERLSDTRLLGSIDRALGALCREQSTFLLGSTNGLLRDMIGQDDASFIFERTGADLHHIMIDEFQDTSQMQFDNFGTLLRNCLGGGEEQSGDCFIFGDVKQAIYRFRGGEWSLLAGLTERNPQYGRQIHREPMTGNFRSENRVVSFNNMFFEHARALAAEQAEAAYGEGADRAVLSAYADYEQQCQKNGDEGYVHVEMILAAEDNTTNQDDEGEWMLQRLAENFRSVLGPDGQPAGSMAILCRENKQLREVVDYLQPRFPNVVFISSETFALSSSLCVTALIDAIRLLLESPGQKKPSEALVRLTQRYQEVSRISRSKKKATGGAVACSDDCKSTISGPISGGTAPGAMPGECMTREQMLAALPSGLTQHRDELARMPLYDLLWRLYQLLGLEAVAGESSYMYAFLDEVQQYAARHGSDLAEFLNEWEERISKCAVPAGKTGEGCWLLTIHKAKGLEFDTVLIPLYKKMRKTQSVWCQSEGRTGRFPQTDYVNIKMKNDLWPDSEFAGMMRQVEIDHIVDQLNVLYVGFTRAKRNLIVLGQTGLAWHRADRDICTFVACALGMSEQTEQCMRQDEERGISYLLYETGELAQREEQGTEDREQETNVITQPAAKLTMEMASQPSVVRYRQSNKALAFSTGWTRQAVSGEVMHEVMARCTCEADVEAALMEEVAQGNLIAAQLPAMEHTLRRAWQLMAERGWTDARWDVVCERDIALSPGDGVIGPHGPARQQRPDRVMLCGSEAVVVDYKFGRPHPEEYAAQVRRYARLLRGMGYTRVSGFLFYVASEQVVEVDPR